jgi:hypothetical protein
VSQLVGGLWPVLCLSIRGYLLTQGRPDDLEAHVQNTKQGPFLDNKNKPHIPFFDMGCIINWGPQFFWVLFGRPCYPCPKTGLPDTFHSQTIRSFLIAKPTFISQLVQFFVLDFNLFA